MKHPWTEKTNDYASSAGERERQMCVLWFFSEIPFSLLVSIRSETNPHGDSTDNGCRWVEIPSKLSAGLTFRWWLIVGSFAIFVEIASKLLEDFWHSGADSLWKVGNYQSWLRWELSKNQLSNGGKVISSRPSSVVPACLPHGSHHAYYQAFLKQELAVQIGTSIPTFHARAPCSFSLNFNLSDQCFFPVISDSPWAPPLKFLLRFRNENSAQL